MTHFQKKQCNNANGIELIELINSIDIYFI